MLHLILFALLAAVLQTCDMSIAQGAQRDSAIKSVDEIDSNTVDLGGDDERIRPKIAPQFRFGNIDVTFTGAATLIDSRYERNFDLHPAAKEDQFNIRPLLDFNTIFDFAQGYSLFTELRMIDRVKFGEDFHTSNNFELQVRDMFLNIPFRLALPVTLRIGRQQFFESRRWYLNDRMDGVQLFSRFGPLNFSAAFASPVPVVRDSFQLFDNFFQKRRQTDAIFNLDYALTENSTLGSYVILGRKHENRLTPDRIRNENPFWIGLRLEGDERVKLTSVESKLTQDFLKPRIKYWLDAAFVGGDMESRKIRGFGLDTGVTLIARKFEQRPFLTFAYAFGSGDKNTQDGVDRNFRQTGLQNNSSRFGGVVNFEYYGVLFQPELSNMHILTAGIGFRPFERASVEFVYHRYLQDHAFGTLRLASINSDPNELISANLNGTNTHLGDEFDIVLGYRGFENVRIRSRTGYFIPGKAFTEPASAAFFARLDVQFLF
ncbi:MAG: alginate export family protein [Nitrosomonas sp.]|nr:alginate export family protein [Nitrosomonas sp.]